MGLRLGELRLALLNPDLELGLALLALSQDRGQLCLTRRGRRRLGASRGDLPGLGVDLGAKALRLRLRGGDLGVQLLDALGAGVVRGKRQPDTRCQRQKSSSAGTATPRVRAGAAG